MKSTEFVFCDTHVVEDVLYLLFVDPPDPSVPTTLSSIEGAASSMSLKRIRSTEEIHILSERC